MSEDGDDNFKSLLRDLTECPICRDTLTDPKTLPCLHTFCCECLSSHCQGTAAETAATCPSCRQPFSVPAGGCSQLRTDFRIRQFYDLKEAARSIRPADWKPCERCRLSEGQGGSAAVLSCTECRELFCIGCGDDHRLAEPAHSLVSLNRRSCNRHPNRQLDIYCHDCEQPGCTMCRIGPHHGHKVADLHEVASTFRHILHSNAVDAANKLTVWKSASGKLDAKKVQLNQNFVTLKRQLTESYERLKNLLSVQADELLQQALTHKKEVFDAWKEARRQLEASVTSLQQVASEGEAIASDGSVFDVVHEFQRLHSTTWKLMAVELGDTAKINVDLEFCPLTMDKLLPPTRRNLLGRVTWPGVPPPADESDLTWAELSEKMRQERAEHERLRKQDADVMRDLRMSEDLMMQLVDLRAQLFNNERRRLNEELQAVYVENLDLQYQLQRAKSLLHPKRPPPLSSRLKHFFQSPLGLGGCIIALLVSIIVCVVFMR